MIESLLQERRTFPPPESFARAAHIPSAEAAAALRREAETDPDGFWLRQAAQLVWRRPPTRALDASCYPFVRWFDDGELNLTESCLDRHLHTPRRNQAALLWEGEPGDTRVLTYQQLHREVCRTANVLKSLGVRCGDRVVLYMPMVPELVVAVLACARLGATHSVIFGGFSAEAIRDRILDAGATCVITADGGWRRGKIVPLKQNVDAALRHCPQVRAVLVVTRTGESVPMTPGRDHFYADLVRGQSAVCPAVPVPAEHPLFILYTSGTTGKPKGVVHSTGGYGTQVALTTRWVFDLRDGDTYWCTADIGWITGHSYVLYGPLLCGGTTLLYEGAPDTPDKDRFWDIVARWGVTILYTAPTAIRAFMRWGDAYPARHDLSSLRLLGTVGEPINPAAWTWYHEVIGGGRCPIVDTWWQTETGAILAAPLPGATPTKPGSCTHPLPGVALEVVRKDGTRCNDNEGGYLVALRPWPAQLRTVWGDPDRYRQQYFSDIQVDGRPVYFTGDGARRDEDGYLWVMGRVDDVLNVAGHRIGTAEVESALVSHPDVAEAAVVGRPDELKGQAIVAFVTLRAGRTPGPEMQAQLKQHVVHEIGALARPEEIRFTEALPKTRSGKIMRRLLRELAAGGKVQGDVTTLEDLSVLQRLATSADEE
ncbi:MAG: acetate--CoA ligase [Myxococcales bacterium]|nr:acetate--CoA ligase [Myxococcota bacterium]MDW8280146.1 acetate--CoA ligase [Myxococcales bacterium]